ncbi:MAG: hypothetical protein LBS63_00030, partial [Prevotellaceae bacterium]|jgi:hypothetical protein|nr:hypothetical protein [Prevotellaceae bacterium]
MRAAVPSIIALSLLLAALLPAAGGLMAQSAAYSRPTVNFVLLDHGDTYDAPVGAAFAKIPAEDKFYRNDLGLARLALPQLSRRGASPTTWQAVQAELARQGVAKRELAAWYSRTPDGRLSMALIHRRGELNATDEAFLMASATKRGAEALRDLGRQLIHQTYVVALDYGSVDYSASAESGVHSWRAEVCATVFKLRYDGDLEGRLYEAWVDEEDAPELVAEKRRRFDQLPFALDFALQATVSVSRSALMPGRRPQKSGGALGDLVSLTMGVSSKEALLEELVRKGYGDALSSLEGKLPAFKVLAGVWELSPIRAKVGKKEGLKTDQRYNVLEYEQDSEGKVRAVRKAVVRVGSGVADNRTAATGQSAASRFYQVAGGRVDKGMTLEQRNDAGMGLLLGGGLSLPAEASRALTGTLRVELLTNKALSLGVWPGLYVYVEGELEVASYAKGSLVAKETDDGSLASYSFSRVGVGLGKGFYFWRNFSLSPYVGVGWEYAEVADIPLRTVYVRAGLNLAINLYYPLQLVGGAAATAYAAPAYNGKEDGECSSLLLRRYDEAFKGRSGSGLSAFAGIRVNF